MSKSHFFNKNIIPRYVKKKKNQNPIDTKKRVKYIKMIGFPEIYTHNKNSKFKKKFKISRILLNISKIVWGLYKNYLKIRYPFRL
jgi:hypothetical protein